MSTFRQVWIKEPYGVWEKATPKPVSKKASYYLGAHLAGSGRPIKVIAIDPKIDPNKEGY